jgi:hypothetical protein
MPETPQSGQLMSRQRFECETAALTRLVKFCNVRTCNEVSVVVFFRSVSTRLPLCVLSFFIYLYVSFTWSLVLVLYLSVFILPLSVYNSFIFLYSFYFSLHLTLFILSLSLFFCIVYLSSFFLTP